MDEPLYDNLMPEYVGGFLDEQLLSEPLFCLSDETRDYSGQWRERRKGFTNGSKQQCYTTR